MRGAGNATPVSSFDLARPNLGTRSDCGTDEIDVEVRSWGARAGDPGRELGEGSRHLITTSQGPIRLTAIRERRRTESAGNLGSGSSGSARPCPAQHRASRSMVEVDSGLTNRIRRSGAPTRRGEGSDQVCARFVGWPAMWLVSQPRITLARYPGLARRSPRGGLPAGRPA